MDVMNAAFLASLLTLLYVAVAFVLVVVVVIAIRRWSLAAELKAEAFDRLVTAIERGALTRGGPDQRPPDPP